VSPAPLSNVLAQSLQKFSRLYEVGGYKIQLELKELEIRLAYNFASQLNKALLPEFDLRLVGLFKPVPRNRNHSLPVNLKLNSLKRVRFLHLNFTYPKLWTAFFPKLKNWPIRDDIKIDIPTYTLFRPILKKLICTKATCIWGV